MTDVTNLETVQSIMNVEVSAIEIASGNPATYTLTLLDGTKVTAQITSILTVAEQKAVLQYQIDDLDAQKTELQTQLTALG